MIRKFTRRLKARLSSLALLPIAGLGLITTAIWIVWFPAGLAAAGISLLLIEWRLDDDE